MAIKQIKAISYGIRVGMRQGVLITDLHLDVLIFIYERGKIS